MKDEAKERLRSAIPFRAEVPCEGACPVSLKCHGYISLAYSGEFEKAFRLIRQRLPFPRILGRICDHPCENYCRRGLVDESVAVRDLKRFIADYAYSNGIKYRPTIKVNRKERVAIVGSGPAGLSAAYDLARQGFPVTVFEALPVAGGMLAVGCPEFKLPKQVLEDEIGGLAELGVGIKLNSPVKDVASLLQKEGYQAVFVAAGTHQSKKSPIPGSELKNVLTAVSFLRDVNLGKPPELGRRIIILGGGNVAVDCARVAIRLGANEVHLICAESREKMLAYSWEIAAAQEEGVVIHAAHILTEILSKQGRVSDVKCAGVERMEFDREGRLEVKTVQSSETVMPADTVVFAIGQVPDQEFLSQSGMKLTGKGFIAADPLTFATNIPGVFAGGDAVSNAGSVIKAIADGQRAALSITCFLNKEPLTPSTIRQDDELIMFSAAVPKNDDISPVRARVNPPVSLVEERKRSFSEVISAYSPDLAKNEAVRCLRCDLVEEAMADTVGLGAGSVKETADMIDREEGMGLIAGTMRRALLGGLQLRLKNTPPKVDNIICTGCYVWGTPFPLMSLTRILKHFKVPYAFLPREECCGFPVVVSADKRADMQERRKALDVCQNLISTNIARARDLGGKNIYQMCQWCTYIANYFFYGKTDIGLNYYVDLLMRVIKEFEPKLEFNASVGYFSGGRHRHSQFYLPGIWDLDWTGYRGVLNKVKGLKVFDLAPYCCVTHPDITMKTMEEKGLTTLVTACITCYGRLMRRAPANIRVITIADLIWEALGGRSVY